MNRLVRSIIASLALSIFALGPAHAGAKYLAPVGVSSNNAYGSLGSARNSVDTNQSIGCYLSAWNTTSGEPYGFCFARNSAGVEVSCSTYQNPALTKVIQSINPDSYIHFMFSGSACTYITIENRSQWEPKK